MRRWLPRPVDLAAAAGLTVVTQVELWAVLDPALPRAAVAAAYAVGTVAVAWHRLAPLTVLAVSLTALAVVPGALGVDPASGLGWFVTAFTVMVSAGYHARRPLLALAIALGLLALSVVLQQGVAVSDIAFAWLLAGGAWLAGRAVATRTVRAELFEQRAALAEQEAQWRAAAAVAEERLRIAREMHDVISHSVSVMTLHVSGVRRLLRPDQVEERAALEAVERTGRESLAEMHRMLGVLRSLPPGIELAAYRIVQEGVTNVLRHASARRVDCTVGYGDADVELLVVDDGRGASATGEGGHGLAGLRERTALYAGSVEAGPRPDGGYALHAVLPVPAAETLPTARDAP
jgi:signal transduction histidine kinase